MTNDEMVWFTEREYSTGRRRGFGPAGLSGRSGCWMVKGTGYARASVGVLVEQSVGFSVSGRSSHIRSSGGFAGTGWPVDWEQAIGMRPVAQDLPDPEGARDDERLVFHRTARGLSPADAPGRSRA